MKHVIVFLLITFMLGTFENKHSSFTLNAATVIHASIKIEHQELLMEKDVGPGVKPPKSVITPFTPLVDFAKKHNIAISGIELANGNAQPQKGDCITLLVTLFQGNTSQQWIALINQDNLNKAELQLSPIPEEVIYTSSGKELHFMNTRTALDVRFIGPFTETSKVASEKLVSQLMVSHRTLVSREQLNFGLDRYARTAINFTQRSFAAGFKINDLSYIGAPSRLTDEQLEKGRRFVKIIHPTEEEERIVFSVTFALNAFLSSALEIDDFSNLVDHVLNKPSIWSVISKLGVDRFLKYRPGDVKPFDVSFLGLNLPAYELPLRMYLNNTLALEAGIIMVTSKPPLQTCAGIVEVYAEHPFNNENRLIIQLVAAKPN